MAYRQGLLDNVWGNYEQEKHIRYGFTLLLLEYAIMQTFTYHPPPPKQTNQKQQQQKTATKST